MKRINLITSIMAVVFALSFVTFGLAQDSTKTRTRKQIKDKTGEQLKDQVRDRKQLHAPVTANSQNQIQHGSRFVDENGDGYNDNAPDADGDGIPNGLDPDYTGPKNRMGKGAKGFVDNDGDGINDNMQAGQGNGGKNRKGGYGPGDGSGNKGMGPKDGTGFGPKTGGCDGTGPKGKVTRGPRK